MTSHLNDLVPKPHRKSSGQMLNSDNVPPENSTFKDRTFDVLWVDRTALMYKDGINKIFDKETRKARSEIKRKSSIPIILRDMAPPEGSTFDPAKKWQEEKERIAKEKMRGDETTKPVIDDIVKRRMKQVDSQNKDGGKKSTGGISAAEIRAKNVAAMEEMDYEQDMQKLSNLKTLSSLQAANCKTNAGKVSRMLKMLHLAVSEFISEAEVLDILWALEEIPSFQNSEALLNLEKSLTKEEKESQKKSSKSKSKDVKKKETTKEKKKDKVELTRESKSLKELLKNGGDARGSFKNSLAFARNLRSGKKDLISFQLTKMHDRLPPLSQYNRQFRLEEWQCDLLRAIDERQSAVVAAPTSSGKTLLSTYTCKNAKGTVLFVLPTEVLVWQIAATYYEFFKGNVTICTDQISFQEITGDAQVYIGTPRALEKALTKARGVAGQEMVRGEKEFMILDGGFKQFDYMVLDEVHTLNGPEGDALQRLIKAITCPCLALSATIGNAQQLRAWLQSVRQDQMELIDASCRSSDPTDVILKEHFARFINLQRWVVTESEGDEGKKKHKLVKLHPMAAMTPERLNNEPDLVAALSMTPTDMMDLWKSLESIFPNIALEDMDNPEHFFANQVDVSKRITLEQTKEYEIHLKKRLIALSKSHTELIERLLVSHLPPPLRSQQDVGDSIYEAIKQVKELDLLPCVAFQLSTYGAFEMFNKILSELEADQHKEFPNYRKDLIKMARIKAEMRKLAAGKASRENAAEAEQEAKAGFEDDLIVYDDTTKPHDKYVLTAASKRMSFHEVKDVIAEMKKSGEPVDINHAHALIRGLRRGIAIYTNEVGFSCYRRQVQILAQKGRLALVFSDSALAYGVNMPFRSCLFCGDMGNELTPLIAQQMQGRAGRRGMDIQGNVIYLGMEWPYIENLMLGQISHITGANPRYPIMSLQRALAAANDPDDYRFVHDKNQEAPFFADSLRKRERVKKCHPTITDNMMHCMADTTLEEFCRGEKKDASYLDDSKNAIVELGWIDDSLSITADHNALSMVWEMKEYLPEAIQLYGCLEHLYNHFCFNKTKNFKESDATQNIFLSVLLHIVDRVPCREGEESLQQQLRISPIDGKSTLLNEDAIAQWKETEVCLIKQTALIEGLDLPEEDKEKMQLTLSPGGGENGLGPPLDKGVYVMLSSRQKGFLDDVPKDRRNELKNRVVRLGQICLLAHNNLQQPHGKYNAMESHFRRLFGNIRYSVFDMMNQLTDQPDITDV